VSAFIDNDAPPKFFEKGYILLFALLPWSVDCSFGTWNLLAPGEPLILLLGLGLALALLRRPSRFLKPGRSWSAWFAVWIIWMGIAAAFSTMKTVSLKYWLVETGHIWVFGFGMLLWPMLWRRATPYFLASMLGMVCYTILHHAMYDFRADQALLAPMPFFPDHTMYASVLAILIFYGQGTWEGLDRLGRFLQKSWVKHGATALLLVALLVSTSRAALISCGIGMAVFTAFYFRKSNKFLAAGALCAAFFVLSFATIRVLDTRTGDVSALERLNRWDCAAAMLAARPYTGFGPGSYQFQYLPFQQPEKMTRISLSAPLPGRNPDTYGRGGGAHSEYWQAGAELGWPGLVLWLTLVFGILWLGFRDAIYATGNADRRLALLTSLGLLTFFAHTLANNFLHDARVAALVWGGIAWIISARKPGALSS
jgi:putative inorganic carbon (hco3(-)) transporter